jgi:hypothetical protein
MATDGQVIRETLGMRDLTEGVAGVVGDNHRENRATWKKVRPSTDVASTALIETEMAVRV